MERPQEKVEYMVYTFILNCWRLHEDLALGGLDSSMECPLQVYGESSLEILKSIG